MLQFDTSGSHREAADISRGGGVFLCNLVLVTTGSTLREKLEEVTWTKFVKTMDHSEYLYHIWIYGNLYAQSIFS